MAYQLNNASLLYLNRGGRCLLCGTGYALFGVFAAPRLDAYRLSRLLSTTEYYKFTFYKF